MQEMSEHQRRLEIKIIQASEPRHSIIYFMYYMFYVICPIY